MSHTGTEVSQSTLPGAGAFMGPVRRVSAGDVVRRVVTTGADTGGRNAVPPSPEVQDAFGRSNPSPESLLDLLFPRNAVTARRGFIEQYRSIPPEAVPPDTIRRKADAETRFMTTEVTWQGLKDVPTRMLITNGGADVVNHPRTLM